MIFGILAVFVAVVLVRTFRFKPKAQPAVAPEALDFSKEQAISSLAELIKCKTISYNDKELEDAEEFLKLEDKDRVFIEKPREDGAVRSEIELL